MSWEHEYRLIHEPKLQVTARSNPKPPGQQCHRRS